MNIESATPFPVRSEAHRLVESVMQEYRITYWMTKLYAARLLHQFARGTDTLKNNGDIDLSEIAAKKVLDIACGSGQVFRNIAKITNEPEEASRRGEPWLSRILCEIGADVTGIDKSLPTERFRLNKRAKRSLQSGSLITVETGWKLAKRDLTQTNSIDSQTFP